MSKQLASKNTDNLAHHEILFDGGSEWDITPKTVG